MIAISVNDLSLSYGTTVILENISFSLEENDKLGGMLTLSESGAILWKALEQGCDLDQLAKVLTAQYDVSEEIARADAAKFVGKLSQLGCIDAD